MTLLDGCISSATSHCKFSSGQSLLETKRAVEHVWGWEGCRVATDWGWEVLQSVVNGGVCMRVLTEHPQDHANDLPCCHRRQTCLSRWESMSTQWLILCLVQEHCHKREGLTNTLVGLAHSPLLVNKPVFGGGYTKTNSLIHGKVSQCQMPVTIFACGHLESLQS